MLTNLLVVFAMTTIIHTAETLSYAVRLAGVRLNKIAVALSLTGMIVLVSRTANMVQGPIAAKFVDYGRTHAGFPMLQYFCASPCWRRRWARCSRSPCFRPASICSAA